MKQAEELSDLGSGSEKEANMKKSRKIRAAKIVETCSSNEDEQSHDNFVAGLPNVPIISNSTHITESQIARDAEIGRSTIKHYNILKK